MERSVTRRINHTQRIEISAADVEIDIRPVVDAAPRVVLRKLILPNGDPHPQNEWMKALVVLEAWRSDAGAYLRFELGHVDDVLRRAPPLLSSQLSGFPDEHGVSFRVKVISSESKILAEADRLKAAADARHQDELIRVFPRDLDQLPWTVDWSDVDEGPCVHVNENIYDYRTFLTRDPVMSALILPSVLREILYRVALEPEMREAVWAVRWIELVTQFSDCPIPADVEDDGAIDEWVLSALHGFSRRHQLSAQATEHMQSRELEILK
ncbi:MAG: hypothetical protein M3Z35_11160 [Nitrospirota bacterium]|nr:hypothetical protein [Nitrospirota bacterium]